MSITSAQSLRSTQPALATAVGPLRQDTELGDAEILHVMHIVHAGVVQEAQLAASRTSDARVKALATIFASDHAEGDRDAIRLADRMRVPIRDNAVSTRVVRDAQISLALLSAQNGLAFDRVYIDSQINQLRVFTQLIEGKLLPQARTADTRHLLEDTRDTVARHLERATSLQQGIGAPTPP